MKHKFNKTDNGYRCGYCSIETLNEEECPNRDEDGNFIKDNEVIDGKILKYKDGWRLRTGHALYRKIITNEDLTPLENKSVEMVGLSIYGGESSTWKVKPYRIVEVQHIKVPPELNSGDWTELRTYLQPDKTVKWGLVGYTEGGYCSCRYYIEDLKKLIDNNPSLLERS